MCVPVAASISAVPIVGGGFLVGDEPRQCFDTWLLWMHTLDAIHLHFLTDLREPVAALYPPFRWRGVVLGDGLDEIRDKLLSVAAIA